MPRPPIIVIADDLTGAAEMAALAHRHGLTATVMTGGHAPGAATDVWVVDTDSRLDPPAVAAAKVARLVPTFRALQPALIYKKPDSVLRGPVRAELEALAAALGLNRVLLLPANPTLGRTVQSGRYAIDGAPLQHTAFGRDPHHPAATDDVCSLLGPSGAFTVHARAVDQTHPAEGIVVGDAASPADLDAWAALPRDASTLLAGAADFFAALLRARGHRLAPLSPAASRLAGPTLILSGTTHPGSAASRSGGRHVAARPAGHPLDIPAWADEIRLRLKQDRVALACFAGPISTDPALPPRLRTALAEIAVTLAAERSFTHLIVEGGATAAAITQALDWRELRLQHAWTPGVASLRPTAAPDFTLTLKPGSYPWPAALSPLSP